jgi:hypothetical protein
MPARTSKARSLPLEEGLERGGGPSASWKMTPTAVVAAGALVGALPAADLTPGPVPAGRAEDLNFGVFAIAMTLLVLDLREPSHQAGTLLVSLRARLRHRTSRR